MSEKREIIKEMIQQGLLMPPRGYKKGGKKHVHPPTESEQTRADKMRERVTLVYVSLQLERIEDPARFIGDACFEHGVLHGMQVWSGSNQAARLNARRSIHHLVENQTASVDWVMDLLDAVLPELEELLLT